MTQPCNCIESVNADLGAKHNAHLLSTLFGKPSRCVIGTAKLDTKKRGRPPVMLASFCPFCGKAYAEATTPAGDTERPRDASAERGVVMEHPEGLSIGLGDGAIFAAAVMPGRLAEGWILRLYRPGYDPVEIGTGPAGAAAALIHTLKAALAPEAGR